ncbi:S-layer homology domain-containing protein [Paenibacillus alba]|uniref:S-layer homology domain-containing protein n=1 Tax=Paenibacillus alba TaxID=1197127 RepID=A0ABU6GAM0_9BACL|nr:S-layer homology domain-containing protein [Paenibacillus alba]MEC0231197.1 S-layer homology domain-containing protein [Paenibacillus alba]
MRRVNIKKRLIAVLMSFVLLVLPMIQSVLGGGKAYAAGTLVWSDITGSGGFNSPYDVAIGSDGTVYVADTRNHKIKKLPSGRSDWEDITGSGGFSYPQGVAVGSDGTVYVADTVNNKIKKLPIGGGAWSDITGSGAFFNPHGMAIGGDGAVYVADTNNHQIKKLTSGGSAWSNITGSGGFNSPYDVAIGSDGTVYVADTSNQQIKKLPSGSSDWESITGSEGFNSPVGVAVGSDGTVYVADTLNQQIKKLPSGSSDWESITGSEGFNNPVGVAVSSDGTVYVADSGTHQITKGSIGYTVSFNNDGGSPAAADQAVIKNHYATEPAAESKTGYTFGGWYSSSDFSGAPFDFATTAITMDQMLYAKWMSQAKAITAFSFEGLSPMVTGTVDETDKTIALTVPYGTDVMALIPTFTTTGVSVNVGSTAQVSGTTPQNFTSAITYTVVAEDGTTQDYTVMVTVAVNTAPTASSVTIAEMAQVGVQLTGTYTFTDADDEDREGTSTYRWLSSSDGTTYIPIAGATSTTYTPVAGDQGNTIKFEVTPKDNHGLAGALVVSAATAAVAPASTNITAFDAIGNVAAGTAGAATYANVEAVSAALLASHATVTANGGTITVPVTAWVDTDNYNPSVAGSYTFTAILGSLPAYTTNTGGLTATVEVVVAPAVINITGFDEIGNVTAGTAGAATYANAGAVSAALLASHAAVTANGGTIAVPVTAWVDTNNYSPSVAGSYTFTAVLGSLPANTTNTGGLTATVLVVVAPAVINITAFDAIGNVTAGTAGAATYANAEAVSAALLASHATVTANGGTIAVPVTAWVDTDNYSPSAAGSYTFTAVLGSLPVNTTNTDGLTTTVEVVVGPATPVGTNITVFDALGNVAAGTVGAATYANAGAVSAALLASHATVTANGGTIAVPVTAWVNTDNYNPAAAGSYTFTATLGSLPANTTNTGGLTATVLVVVAPATQVRTNITVFDAIVHVAAGTVGAATYANAEVVSAALIASHATVTANGGTITVPVTAWVNTDNYNPGAAGSYTFTATLGGLPANTTNTGSLTATVEVVVTAPSGGSGSGSDGGGGTASPTSDTPVTSTDGTLTLPVGKTGKVSLGDAITISIPADAISKELKLTIDKLLNIQNLVKDKDVLASPVFEILKNFSENFSKSVTLTFAFDPSKLRGNQTVAVFFFDETKKEWVKVSGGAVHDCHITVEVNHFTKYAVFVVGQGATDPTPDTMQPAITLSDISGHWAEANIKQAISRGIVSGYPDGTFKPGKTVTRAEFAVMLMNTLKLQGEGAELTFTDSAQIGAWAKKAVAQAVQAGIINGYEDGSFRPDAVITRAEMAAMITAALGKSNQANAATGFADDKDIPAWAKASVAYVKQAGIVQGKGDNQFAPLDNATRAEAVTVLLNMLAQKSK